MEAGGKAETTPRTAQQALPVADLPLAPVRRPPIETLLRRTVLATAIGLACLLGYLTTYALLLLFSAVLAYILSVSRHIALDLPAGLFLCAFGALVVAATATATQPADLLHVLNFAALLFYAPLAALFRRSAAAGNTRKVADFALYGTAVGLLVSLYFTYVLGNPRAGLGSSFTDPIRLSNTALLLGFLAMIGTVATSGQQRFIYLLGPLMSLAVIFACGTRAALVAFPVLLVASALLMVRHTRRAFATGLLLLLGFGLVTWLADTLGARSSTLVDILGRLAAGDNPADLGTNIRFILYRAGSAAFLDAPLFGHGWPRLMQAIVPYLGPFEQVHAELPHLHDDMLNFAVAAGLVGVAVYLLLLVTPVLACLRGPRDSQYRARLSGCILLSMSFLVLGLPDTMLSFPLHITLYVVLTAILLNYCTDRADRETG